ncbi:MAG: ATP-binding protein, partial [Candidatus Methanoplasma sp.]|nr:ATP-binding protein [Candidatus Methanoplasma sp.]
MKDVERRLYIDRMMPFVDNNNAKVAVGIRRGGKSTIMNLLIDRLSGDGVNIIRINMELMENRDLRDHVLLYGEIKKRLDGNKKNILFIDEIQDVKEWESAIRSLIAERCCDIYLTGSNSRLLSSEYSTYLTGRLNILSVFPLTFRECLDFERAYRGRADEDETFDRFMQVGGFPNIWRNGYGNDSAYEELRVTLSYIRDKDILSRYGVRNTDLLDRILSFLCDNVGKYTSLNNLYNHLRSAGVSAGKDAVYAYARYLEEAGLVNKVGVYDVRGRAILSSKCKYFLADIGLKHAVRGHRESDIPGHMENI